MSELKCVVVTPEQTELDVTATSVTLPMFDGEMGILKGHSPLVGRLGFGVLRVNTGSSTDNYFIEGGFAQVADNVVNVLTDGMLPMSEVTRDAASKAMNEALEIPTDQAELAGSRSKAIARAEAMARAAG